MKAAKKKNCICTQFVSIVQSTQSKAVAIAAPTSKSFNPKKVDVVG